MNISWCASIPYLLWRRSCNLAPQCHWRSLAHSCLCDLRHMLEACVAVSSVGIRKQLLQTGAKFGGRSTYGGNVLTMRAPWSHMPGVLPLKGNKGCDSNMNGTRMPTTPTGNYSKWHSVPEKWLVNVPKWVPSQSGTHQMGLRSFSTTDRAKAVRVWKGPN